MGIGTCTDKLIEQMYTYSTKEVADHIITCNSNGNGLLANLPYPFYQHLRH